MNHPSKYVPVPHAATPLPVKTLLGGLWSPELPGDAVSTVSAFFQCVVKVSPTAMQQQANTVRKCASKSPRGKGRERVCVCVYVSEYVSECVCVYVCVCMCVCVCE